MMHCSRQTMLMFLVFLSFGWSTLANAQKSVSFELTEIFIETKSGQHRFAVEFAHTPEQLSFGLMFRRALPGTRECYLITRGLRR